MKKLLILFLATLLPCLRADTMTADGKTYNGMYQNCQKGTITFMEFDGTSPLKIDFMKVAKIKFDKPANATLTLTTDSKKTGRPCKIKGYSAKNGFSLIVDGKKQNARPSQIAGLAVKYSLKDFAAARDDAARQAQQDDEAPAPQKAAKFLTKGKAALIHFDDGSAASTRQGHLAERLCGEKGNGRIQYIKLPCTIGSEMARKNGIESTPQFWFFKTEGDLLTKLAETFTEEQITEAFTKLKKGR